MTKLISGIGSIGFTDTALSNVSDIIERTYETAAAYEAAYTSAIPISDTEVNNRPAAQQWTVCTP